MGPPTFSFELDAFSLGFKLEDEQVVSIHPCLGYYWVVELSTQKEDMSLLTQGAKI